MNCATYRYQILSLLLKSDYVFYLRKICRELAGVDLIYLIIQQFNGEQQRKISK